MTTSFASEPDAEYILNSQFLVRVERRAAADMQNARGRARSDFRAMTKSARLVLADCEEAASEIDSGVQGATWRRRWITSVVLLRVVGHVLVKVDSSQSANHKAAIEAAWKSLQKSKPGPAIFWQFIEDERNNILKEYRLSAGQGVTVRPGGVSVNLSTGVQNASEGLPPIYHYVINDGPFKGRDQRQLLGEAIEWWRSYLNAVDSDIAARNAEQGV